MTLAFNSLGALRTIAALCFCTLPACTILPAQETSKKSTEQSTEKAKPLAEAENPAQIELLETHIRFESNGDSRKEVHTRVRINNELGVQQFARINFGYNRAFESVEIPLVHITHASGGSIDILSSAITDQPNPAVVNAPAYQDVRIKSVRILGLEPGDLLEYQVITTVSDHPLAPDFWLEHTFDRSGVVSREIFTLDLPSPRNPEIRINPTTPAASIDKGDAAVIRYRWEHTATNAPQGPQTPTKELEEAEPDIALSTEGWEPLSIRLDEMLTPGAKPLEKISSYQESIQELSRRRNVAPEIAAKALELTKAIQTNKGRLEAIYDFVSQKITTIDLPLGASGFAARPANEILTAGYATPEDKFVLFAALTAAIKLDAQAALTGYCDSGGVPRPSVFKHLLISANDGDSSFWLDPSLEVAPFGMISPIPEKCAFVLNRAFHAMNSTGHEWQPLNRKLPFAARQKVDVDASLAPDGTLTSKVRYALRGDNELLLRIAFHQTPKEKWRDVAQLLAFSDGFRGKITSIEASDPYATKEPFTVGYEISQPKFVDWSKKPVRIPALLPQLGLPDAPGKPAAGVAMPPIELGTPLEVETHVVVHLPAGTTARAPIGVSVSRDYATFASRYSTSAGTITATRHVNFLLRELPAERTADYNSFRHAVQNDEAQDFTLEPAESVPTKRNSAAPDHPAPPKPNPAKP